ncbi:hypothetical protein QJS66_01710 [Kocuria rhizophila]|nr:hypothetical protein QJS66_01710 [Kocuria rhizophila]
MELVDDRRLRERGCAPRAAHCRGRRAATRSTEVETRASRAKRQRRGESPPVRPPPPRDHRGRVPGPP